MGNGWMRPLFRIGTEVPLLGSIAFGLIDRGTNIIQVRPVSGCPLNCIFCSIDEGPKSKSRYARYEVELDHLLEWFRWLVKFKGSKHIEAHIDCAGEPLLYPKLVELVAAISEVKGVEVISMQTHGTLLDERKVDKLAAAGLSRINLSIDSVDPEKARMLSGTPSYNLERVMHIAEYIASTKIDLLLAPVWVPGYNDEDMPELVKFALRIGAGRRWPPLGIQKYEAHRRGRKPARSWDFRYFYGRLAQLERRFGLRLRLRKGDFGIMKMRSPPIPFEMGEAIKVRVVGPGWIKGEALGVAGGRSVTLVDMPFIKPGIELKAIVRSNKHNIIVAKPTEKSLMFLRAIKLKKGPSSSSTHEDSLEISPAPRFGKPLRRCNV